MRNEISKGSAMKKLETLRRTVAECGLERKQAFTAHKYWAT